MFRLLQASRWPAQAAQDQVLQVRMGGKHQGSGQALKRPQEASSESKRVEASSRGGERRGRREERERRTPQAAGRGEGRLRKADGPTAGLAVACDWPNV